MAKEITYEIVREIGVIATQASGWTRELNLKIGRASCRERV